MLSNGVQREPSNRYVHEGLRREREREREQNPYSFIVWSILLSLHTMSLNVELYEQDRYRSPYLCQSSTNHKHILMKKFYGQKKNETTKSVTVVCVI